MAPGLAYPDHQDYKDDRPQTRNLPTESSVVRTWGEAGEMRMMFYFQ